MHKHKCPKCKLIWEHPDSGAPNAEVYAAAHLCPGCGTDVRLKLYNVQPNVIHPVQYKATPQSERERREDEMLQLLAALFFEGENDELGTRSNSRQ